MAISTVYILEGFNEKQMPKARKKLDKFHEQVSGDLLEIETNSFTFKVQFGKSITGAGLFNRGRVHIPAGTRIAYLIAIVMPIMHFKQRPEEERDRSYSFVKKWMGTDRWFDGKPMLEEYDVPWNLSFVNHSCDPNCAMEWHDEFPLPLLILTTTKDIPPNGQLTSDYNNGMESGYMVPVSSLVGVPKEDIVFCACAYPLKCPLERGFDRLAMERSIWRSVPKEAKGAAKKKAVKAAD